MTPHPFGSFFGPVLASLIVSSHAPTQHDPIENVRDAGGARLVRRADNAGQTADKYVLNDGSPKAPICTVQHPYLLKGYRTRPQWKVAGVDYCVGYPANTLLKNPATISMEGVSVDVARKSITVT